MSERHLVVDSHFHIGVNPLIKCEPDDLFTWMDQYGIDVQMIMQVNEGFTHQTPEWNPFLGNDFISDVQSQAPDRIIGLGRVNPHHQPPPGNRMVSERLRSISVNPVLDELDRAIGELGLWGLKMHPVETHYQINNPTLINPIMKRLVSLQEEVGRRLVLFIHAAGDSLNNSPEALADIARQFPELLFCASHSGYKWGLPTVGHTMAALSNVMLDLTTMAGTGPMKEIYDKYGPEKFCTGSDGPFASVGCKNAIVQALTSDPDDQALILGGNLARHFGLA